MILHRIETKHELVLIQLYSFFTRGTLLNSRFTSTKNHLINGEHHRSIGWGYLTYVYLKFVLGSFGHLATLGPLPWGGVKRLFWAAIFYRPIYLKVINMPGYSKKVKIINWYWQLLVAFVLPSSEIFLTLNYTDHVVIPNKTHN